MSSSSSSVKLLLVFLLQYSLILNSCLGIKDAVVESAFYTFDNDGFFVPATTCNKNTNSKGLRDPSLRVFHTYGPCSRLGNSPTLAQLVEHDRHRIDVIASRLSTSSSGSRSLLMSTSADLPVYPKTGTFLGYYITVGIGTPSVPIDLTIDTGSDITWTQCKSCQLYHCMKQTRPIFNEFNSRSYSNLTCEGYPCTALDSATEFPHFCVDNTCCYVMAYADFSISKGFFAKERLTLSPTTSFDNFYFGCGVNNSGDPDVFLGTSGMMGLGRNSLSIVMQTSSKFGGFFSYCLPSINTQTGHLTFGNNGFPSNVKFTPMKTNSKNNNHYFVGLVGISVDGVPLQIDPIALEKIDFVVDVGASGSFLPSVAYKPLQKAFKAKMSMYPLRPASFAYDTCFDLSGVPKPIVPKISLHFSDGATLNVPPSGTLVKVDYWTTCLYFGENFFIREKFGIIGANAQMTNEVVIDVANGWIGFGPNGCN